MPATECLLPGGAIAAIRHSVSEIGARRKGRLRTGARCTLQAATSLARRAATGSGKPSARKTARLPVKASPAPVGSTAITAVAGTCSVDRSSTIIAPRSPSVTMTVAGPRRRNLPAARATAPRVSHGSPVSFSSSVSLGTQQSVNRSNSSGRDAAGAGFRIVVTPEDRAIRKASSVVLTGISSWASTI